MGYSWNYMPPAQRRPRFRNKGTRDGYPKKRIRLLTLLSRCAGGLEDAPCTRVTSTWPQASAKETLGWSADSSSTFSFHLRMTHESLGRLSNVGERDATRRWRTDELLVSVETKHEDVSGSVVETPVVAVHELRVVETPVSKDSSAHPRARRTACRKIELIVAFAHRLSLKGATQEEAQFAKVFPPRQRGHCQRVSTTNRDNAVTRRPAPDPSIAPHSVSLGEVSRVTG